MSVLDEAQNIVDDKFDAKRREVYQEFRVLVRVVPSDKNPDTVRGLLDNVNKHLGDYLYADGTGSLQIVQVEPK